MYACVSLISSLSSSSLFLSPFMLTCSISLTFTAGPVSLCGVSSPWSVCEVVVVPYVVRAVVAVTVMHVLCLCCMCVCCEGARVTAVLV